MCNIEVGVSISECTLLCFSSSPVSVRLLDLMRFLES